MKPPVAQMTKREILKLWRYKCKHGHSGFSHYNCYLRETGTPEKVGFIDIETSNLRANYGIMLSYCIKPAGSTVKQILKNVVGKEELIAGSMDKRLVKDCIEDMRKFDRIIGHYSSRFDIPFIRTRAIMHNVEFPQYGELVQTDTWRMAKNSLCLNSNLQAVIAESLLGKTVKTRIKQTFWIKALQGDEEALAYVLDHNIKDVIDLEKNYFKMLPYCRKQQTSI